MDSDSDETNTDPARPTWLEKLHPRAVGSRCWSRLRLDANSHGQLLCLLSSLPAVVITPIAMIIALLLYAIGYSLTRPNAMIGGG